MEYTDEHTTVFNYNDDDTNTNNDNNVDTTSIDNNNNNNNNNVSNNDDNDNHDKDENVVGTKRNAPDDDNNGDMNDMIASKKASFGNTIIDNDSIQSAILSYGSSSSAPMASSSTAAPLSDPMTTKIKATNKARKSEPIKFRELYEEDDDEVENRKSNTTTNTKATKKARKQVATRAARKSEPIKFRELYKDDEEEVENRSTVGIVKSIATYNKLAKSLVRSSMEMIEFDYEEIKVESDGSIWAMVSNTERLDNSGFPIANETAIKKYIANGLKFLTHYKTAVNDMMDVAKLFDKTQADKHIAEFFNEDDEE